VIILNSITTWQEALLASWSQVWTSFLTILPTIIGATIIFAAGLILAFWVKKLVIRVLKLVKVEKYSKSLGIDKYLSKADIKFDFVQLVGTFVEWLIILIFFLTVVDILGLSAVSRVLAGILGYVPNILAAALIFGAGFIVAGIVDGLVRGAFASVNHEVAKPIGKVARWLVLLVSFFAAIDQLQIAQSLVAVFFQGLTYTVVLVVGLSVGLGSKDLVSKILDGWYEKLKK
jgi:hypothetical protein